MLGEYRTGILLSIIFLFFAGVTGMAEESPTDLTGLTWVTEEFPPYNFMDNGTASGLMVDMITAIARKAGEDLPRESITFLPWSEAYQNAVHTPGTVIFSIARTPEREDLFSWIGPVVTADITLYSSRSRNISIHDPADLAEYTIGAVADDVAIDSLIRSGIDKTAIITGPDPYTMITCLENGTIDLFAYGDIAAEYHIRNATGKSGYFRVSGRIDTVPVYIGVNKETSPILVKKLREGFEALKKTATDGGMSEYDQILSCWLAGAALTNMQYLTEGYYPYTFLEDGIAKGISVDILRSIFSRYAIDVPDDHFVFGVWEDVYNTTLTRNGTALCILARSPERENLFRWAGPIDRTPVVIFSLQDRADTLRNTSPSEMKIGSITADIADTALIEAGGRDIVYSDDPADLIRMLEKGEIDGWAYALTPGLQRIHQYSADPSSITPVQTLRTYDFYIGFNRNTPEPLVRSFQDLLDLVRTEKDETGVSMYEQILYRYVIPSYSESIITEEDVKNLVNTTVSDLTRDTPDTIRRINAGLDPYKSANTPGLYVFVYDPDVNMVAHADNIRMVGINYHNKTDVAKNPFRDQIVTGALENGSGWVDYIYSSQVESGLFWKTTWYQLAVGSDGKKYIVCAGMFRNHPA